MQLMSVANPRNDGPKEVYGLEHPTACILSITRDAPTLSLKMEQRKKTPVQKKMKINRVKKAT
jgi:hypothetical protein